MTDLEGKRVLLGVTGGIAAYKSVDLVRRLRDAGAEVQVVMTAGAQRFVTPLTFQAVSRRRVRTDLWDESGEATGHIDLARRADRVVVAPASADFMARLVHGRADDLLTTVCLATEAPLSLCPAMNPTMWSHPATAANRQTLAGRGVTFIGPESGPMAEDESGPGRMSEPLDIVAALGAAAGRLKGRRVMVTAGPTREPVDPVRYITNRSSGRMGFAVARAAAEAGASVTLVAGPVHLPAPPGVTRVDVETTDEMYRAVMARLDSQDVFVGTAAVVDFRPVEPATRKLRKSAGEGSHLDLEETEDILAAVAGSDPRPFTVGFAAETDDLEDNARKKLEKKRLDMVAANRVGPGLGFDTDDNALEVFWKGSHESLPQASKTELARRLIELISNRLEENNQ